jgi:hypothetical protein
MPRIDRTFNKDDVLRIVREHLTETERTAVVFELCGITDFQIEKIIILLRLILDAARAINDLIEPIKKWLKKIPFLKSVVSVLEYTELILEGLLYLIEFFEKFESV